MGKVICFHCKGEVGASGSVVQEQKSGLNDHCKKAFLREVMNLRLGVTGYSDDELLELDRLLSAICRYMVAERFPEQMLRVLRLNLPADKLIALLKIFRDWE